MKYIKKNLKRILIGLGLWDLVKRLTGRDRPSLLNSKLNEEGNIFYSQFLKKDDLVFDVGANYGNRVEIFLKLGCRVVAIEPQQKCIEYLEQRFINDISLEKVGLGASRDFKVFYESDNSVLSTFSDAYIEKVKDSRHTTTFWKPSDRIEITTLDLMVEKYGNPEFIKIDVEGYELEVLKGLTRYAGVISFEYTLPELAGDLHACLQRLHEIGYNAFNYSVGESMKFNTDWFSYEDFAQKVSSKSFISARFGDIYAKKIF